MKKVLFIAYDFPPARTGGVYRPVKFAKYLPEFGWKPVILTVSNYSKEVTDESLLSELPADLKVYRAYSFEIERLENWIYSKLYGKSDSATTATTPAQSSEPVAEGSQSFLKKYIFTPIQRFIQNVVHTPDPKIGWAPLAVLRGLRAIRKEKIDVIYSTSPPETNQLVGFFLSLLTRKPLVADFRDPWTTHYTRQNMGKLRTRYEKWLERRIMLRASAVIHTGDGRARLVKEAFPDVESVKHHVITNGYDEEDYLAESPKVFPAELNSFLKIVSLGFIYPDTAFSSFLKGFALALSNEKTKGKIISIFIGQQAPDIINTLTKSPFDKHVTLSGFLPHKKAIQRIQSADVLLLLLPMGDNRMSDKIIAGRTFEYMRTGKSILMIGWDGETVRMIEKSGQGKFIPHDNIEEIARALEEYYTMLVEGRLDPEVDWDYIRTFDRKSLTKALAGIFDNSLTVR